MKEKRVGAVYCEHVVHADASLQCRGVAILVNGM
jgi:hypothetical protein